MSNELVLVTGGSGFIGVHCILQLLSAGYRVRTTVRSLRREADVRAMLATGGAQSDGTLAFAETDLMSDAGWPEAVAGCDFVLHVASPFPATVPKHEDELIIPAREGTLRVMRAARDQRVQRVVLTSSFAAIGYGQKAVDRPFSENDWTDTSGTSISAYVKSKTLAERAAWNFLSREGGALELSVINPVGVFGPALGPPLSTSVQIIKRMLDGTIPGFPQMHFGVVDVRDVADLHLRAMINPAAKNERFLAVAGDFMTLREIAQVLKERMRGIASRVTTRVLPNWMVRLVALFDQMAAQIVPELGATKNATHEKATQILGWEPLSREEAIVSTAESLVQLGLLKNAEIRT